MGNLKLKFTERNTDKNKITFNHQMAKVRVMLTFDGISPDKNISVKLLNVEGVEGGGSEITCYKPDGSTSNHVVILRPQQLEFGRQFIHVTVDGNTFSYVPMQITSFESGRQYTYNITVTATGIKVSDAVITDWTAAADGDVNAGVPLQVVAEKEGKTLSRASGTSWDSGDIIGISVTETEGTTVGNNVPYTLSDGTWSASANPIVFNDMQTVTFSAYYPYAETVESGKIAGNTTDQSKQSEFDYMFTSGVTASMSNPRVSFTGEKKFRHRMSRINITVKAGMGVDNLDGLAACTIRGLVADGTFDTNTGTAAATVSGTASDMTVTSNGSSTFSFIVFPQEVTNSFTVEVENGNNLYGIDLSVDGGKLLPGSNYSYNVTLNKQS